MILTFKIYFSYLFSNMDLKKMAILIINQCCLCIYLSCIPSHRGNMMTQEQDIVSLLRGTTFRNRPLSFRGMEVYFFFLRDRILFFTRRDKKSLFDMKNRYFFFKFRLNFSLKTAGLDCLYCASFLPIICFLSIKCVDRICFLKKKKYIICLPTVKVKWPLNARYSNEQQFDKMILCGILQGNIFYPIHHHPHFHLEI